MLDINFLYRKVKEVKPDKGYIFHLYSLVTISVMDIPYVDDLLSMYKYIINHPEENYLIEEQRLKTIFKKAYNANLVVSIMD